MKNVHNVENLGQSHLIGSFGINVKEPMCYDTNRLELELSKSPNNKAVRLPLKFKCILTQYPQMCNQLR